MWVAIWCVLVVGAVVVLALVGRKLWRSAKALGRELSRASDVAERFSDALDAATRAQEARDGEIRAQLDDDPAELRDRVALLRAERAERGAARQAVHEATYRRWLDEVRARGR